MSEYGCYPSVKYTVYKPGEVRLYGRETEATSTDNIVIPRTTFVDILKKSKTSRELTADQRSTKIEDALQKLEKEQSKISDDLMMVSIQKEKKRYGLTLLDEDAIKEIKSIGVIYGYAFEGHCYKLPKPTIMLLPGPPYRITDGDCGYDSDLGYSVWSIDKLAPVVILDVRTDNLKTLVLDANTPGNRSPLAYSQHQALAPQRNRD